jgi:serine/threonine protein kinase
VRIGRETAEGLGAAHAKGLIHRDIKPANIWLEADRGRVKIVDFGLARAAESDIHLTQEGLVMGTPAYMAPEQANGEVLDFRCDLFSLGCVLYRTCTGQLPFPGKDSMAVMMAIASKPVEPPSEIDPGIPRSLSDLILQLLAKDPDERPRSARAVADALAEIERSLGTSSAAAAPPARKAEDSDLVPIDNDLVSAEEEVVDAVAVAAVKDQPETVDDVEVVEEVTREEATRRRRPEDTPSGPRKKRRPGRPDEEEGSERLVLILGMVVACLILLLLAFLSLRRVLFHSETSSRDWLAAPRIAAVAPFLAESPSGHNRTSRLP